MKQFIQVRNFVSPPEQWKQKERKDTGKIKRYYPNIIFIYLINLMLFLMPARSEKGRRKGWDGLGAEVWVNHKSGAASQGERMEDVGCKGTIKAWICFMGVEWQEQQKQKKIASAIIIVIVVIFLIKIYHLCFWSVGGNASDFIIVKKRKQEWRFDENLDGKFQT